MPNAAVSGRDFSAVTLASEADEVLVFLLELNHKNLDEPIRVSSDISGEIYKYDEETGEPIYCTRSMDKVFLSFPFSFIPPGPPDGNTPPAATLTISNVDRRVIKAIREIHDGISLQAWIVFASDPDDILSEMPPMWLKSVEYDATQITASLEQWNFFNEVVPFPKFLRWNFPGLYK